MQLQGARALLENTPATPPTPAILTALNKAETLLQEALADVRRSVAALRSASIDRKSLPATLSDLVKECKAITGLAAHFHLSGSPRPLNSQVELTLYRVVQEGLTNARKYAGASEIKVTLCYKAETVRLSICDNGQGSADLTGGFGLIGLRERVQLVDGVIQFHTAPGEGFDLKVEIPT
jgi:signal transduction histidine kinase